LDVTKETPQKTIALRPLRVRAGWRARAALFAARIRRHYPLVFPLLLTCFVFRVWLVPSVPIAAVDFPSFTEGTIRGGAFGWPHLWSNIFFGESLLYWASYMPCFALGSFLQSLGASWPLVERVLWLWPCMFLLPLCGYYMCYYFTRNSYAAALGATLFTVNSWTIGIVERGHIPSVVTAALMALLFPSIVDFTEKPSPRGGAILALLVTTQMLVDVRYAYESMLVLTFVSFLAVPRLVLEGRLRWLLTGGVAFAIVFGLLNLDILLPGLLATHAPSWSSSSSAFETFSGFTWLLSAFSFYFPFYHFVIGSNAFEATPTEPLFMVVALIAWLGLLLTRRRRSSRVLAILAALAVCLVSGSRGEFGQFNTTLYTYVPGLALFRDFSKFNSVVAVTYAVGFSLALVSLFGFIRLRLGRLARIGIAVSAVLAAAGYLYVVRDAFNPLRQSNFVREDPISADGAAAERFMSRDVGDARVLIMPIDARWNSRDRPFPTADAYTMAMNPPPMGYALLNPQLCCSIPQAVLDDLGSPLAPAMLSELRVKYLVVSDERSLYYNFDNNLQRWPSVDFLRQQDWLREVAHFGRSVVFEMKQPPVPRAFFAPYPALVIGSPAALEGLVATPLWTNQAAALIADQMPARADWLSLLPNVVEGPTLIDPEYPIGGGGPSAQAQRLAERTTAERYRQRSYSAFVFSSSMLSKYLAKWNLESPFGFHFRTPSTAPAKLSLLLEGKKEQPSVLIRNSGAVAAIAAGADRPLENSEVVCNRAQVWHQQFDAMVNALSVADTDAGKVLFVNNPCPVNYQASLTVRVTSTGLLPRPFSITYGNLTREFSAPPAIFARFGAGSVVLSDVLLRPGLNLFQFNKPAAGALWIDSAYTISDLYELGGAFAPFPLRLGVRHSQLGNLVYASADIPRPGLHVGYLDLFGRLALPLDEHPLCTLKYTATNAAAGFALVLDLRNRTTGRELSMWVPTESRQDADYDVHDLVEHVFDQTFANEVAYHRGDSVWTVANFKKGAASPDDYTLLGVRLAATWSISETSDIPRSTFIALIRGVRLATDWPQVGNAWAYRENTLIPTGAAERTFSLRGMKLLRVESVSAGSRPHLAAQFSGFNLLGYRLAASLHVGDYVELDLQNARQARGTVLAVSSDYVLLQDGDNPPQRIARVSISTVARQDVTRSVKFTVPISTSFDPTGLSFDVRSDASLKLRIALEYQAPSGSIETIPAVDTAQSDVNGADVEARFLTPSVNAGGGTLFDLSVPIDVDAALSAGWTNYDLDLWSIERYRFGGVRHRLVGLTFEFTQVQTDLPPDRQYSVAVANLVAGRDRLAAPNAMQRVTGIPLLALDDAPVELARESPAESSQYDTGQVDVGQLAAGNHVVQSLPLDEINVRAATLSYGAPAPFQGGRLERFDQVTASEASGSFSGSGLWSSRKRSTQAGRLRSGRRAGRLRH